MDQNPWSSESTDNRNPYASHDASSQQGQQYQPAQHSHQSTQDAYQPPPGPPPRPYETTPLNLMDQDPTDNPWGSSTAQGQSYQPPSQSYSQTQSQSYSQPQSQSYGQQPTQSIQRSNTDDLLDAEPDRAEQVEHMQQYEASKPMSEDDRNQEELQRQFPGIDSSLIAAIYNDHKQGAGRIDMPQIREMLQELQS